MKEVYFIDRLSGFLVAFYFYYQKLFGGKYWRCKESPDGSHFWVLRDAKEGCKFCGLGKPRTWVKDAKGRE